MTAPTERVGRYQLLEPIGLGPCGSVSRAKVFGVAGFERQFAVKRFHVELTATAATAAMLSAAARAYGSLEHPRIARMSEFGVAQGTTFTAVELVAGLDAMRLIAEARLAGATLAAGGALALVSQAARAVGYAHGRGLTHLGLAPTNVIVTGEGDIKITDFGILSATLPPKPTDVARLANRIPYLAPEQLANEATSAATDVFALGVIAYELVTGQRTFRGETAQQIASAIMAGPPAEPPLPRPIVRVLQRCLARSPFERFPDARALADALDAALRVAPVPGTRKDIGAQVKETLDRLSSLRESELSGMVALNIGTGPVARIDPPASEMADLERASAQTLDLVATSEFVRPDVPVPGPAPLVGPAQLAASASAAVAPGPSTTFPDLPRPMTTVPGLAPPPIPVPPGLAPPPIPPPPASGGARTILGLSPPPQIPQIKPRAQTAGGGGVPVGLPPSGIPTVLPYPSPSRPNAMGSNGPGTQPMPPVPPRLPTARPGTDLAVPVEDSVDMELISDEPSGPTRERAPTAPPPIVELGAPPPRDALQTEEMAPVVIEGLNVAATTKSTAEMASAVADAWRAGAYAEFPDEAHATGAAPPPSGPLSGPLDVPMPRTATPPPWDRPPAGAIAQQPPFAQPLAAPPLTPLPMPRPATAPPPMGGPLSNATGPTPTMPGGMMAPPRAASPAPNALLAGAQSNRMFQPMPGAAQPMAMAPSPARKSRAGLWAVVGLLGAAAIGLGGYYAYTASQKSNAVAQQPAAKSVDAAVAHAAPDAARAAPDAAQVAVAPDAAPIASPDAAQVAIAAPDAAPIAPPDAAQVAVAAPDAAAAKAPDAAQVAAVGPGSGAASGDLVITSTPPGARVFLDGADTGVTPLKLPGSPDRHTIALLLPGHELYVAQVDGHGPFQIPLKEVTPSNGPAGIKVLKCAKERYYVYVDGKATGQTCPTERIGTTVGPHTVEVYDVVSETHRKWDIVVKDERLSFRVRVE